MDVTEVFNNAEQTPNRALPGNSHQGEKRPAGDEPDVVPRKISAEEHKRRLLELVEQAEDVPDSIDETGLKRMILSFEKRVNKNQELRIKYSNQPTKFVDSEVDLHAAIQELHVIATQPNLYGILVQFKAHSTLLQLLLHSNTDIAVAVVDLLQELTDIDEDNQEDSGIDSLIDALMDEQLPLTLVQNMDRMDESIKEEASAIHNSLGIIENIIDVQPELTVTIAKQGILAWILKRLKLKAFEANKLYCSEILSILLQNQTEVQKMLGEADGIDILLQQLATYKRNEPSSNEEIEYMENIFNCVCSILSLNENRVRFVKGEGIQLMILMLKEKHASRNCAIKVLNHACSGDDGGPCCSKLIESLGLRAIFPLFMRTPKRHKKAGPNQEELEEHIISIVTSLVRHSEGAQRQRLMTKFSENNHEKIERLLELHFKYLERVEVVNKKVEKEREQLLKYGEVDEENEEEFYMQRLEAGLFCLQMVDYTLVEVSQAGQDVKNRIFEILRMRGASSKVIKTVVREYADNIGDAMDEDDRRHEQERILQLVDEF
ncbi:DgyrCDS340 [Dimorphilus gyrociliatus]|uniref:Beta-catenin-like protein 1 n=1 Tax=Dimorphilus gyrociliatus TaxID=2664684 RepID=A0A7I8V6U3_9ANNE|nr:DgyrCDS340 [Dimorphilus gyrociliatus]